MIDKSMKKAVGLGVAGAMVVGGHSTWAPGTAHAASERCNVVNTNTFGGVDFSGLDMGRRCDGGAYTGGAVSGKTSLNDNYVAIFYDEGSSTIEQLRRATVHELTHALEWKTTSNGRKSLYRFINIDMNGDYFTIPAVAGSDLEVWMNNPRERLAESVAKCVTGAPAFGGMNLVPDEMCPSLVQEVNNLIKDYGNGARNDVADPDPSTTGLFSSTTPTRLLDTRITGAVVPAGGEVTVNVKGVAPLNAGSVTAGQLNITVVLPGTDGYIKAFPSDGAEAQTSTVNFVRGVTTPNNTTIKTSADGSVTLKNYSGSAVDLVVDLTGGYLKNTTGDLGGALKSVDPIRILDTRQGPRNGVSPFGTLTIPVAGIDRGTVPFTQAKAVVLNLTVTEGTRAGHAIVYNGSVRPNASNLNWTPGENRSNQVVVPLNPDGTVTLANMSNGYTHFVVDLAGYYAAGDSNQAGSFIPVTPCRLLETRPSYNGSGAFGDAETRTISTGARCGVASSSPAAVVLNTTAIDPTYSGYGQVFPSGTARPTTSTVNFVRGDVVPNTTAIRTTNGNVDLYNGSAKTDFVVDIQGWFR